MPVDVFQDGMELNVPVLKAADPPRGSVFPQLTDSGHVAQRPFQTVAIENEYLKIQLLPDLGGRILSVFDKRFGRELLPLPERLTIEPGPAQGVQLPFGIEFAWSATSRGGSMDPVAFQVDEASGAILLAEHAYERSWHLRISLAEEEAAILVEARILNRTFQPVEGNSGLLIHGPDPHLRIEAPEERVLGLGKNGLRFDGEVNWLNGRQVDEWTVRVVPAVNVGASAIASNGVIFDLDSDRVKLETTRPCEVQVVLGLGESTVEAEVQLYPEQTTELPFGDVQPVAAVILEEGRELLRWPESTTRLTAEEARPLPDHLDIQSGTRDPAIRHLVFAQRAIASFKQGDAVAADAALEQALAFNAEDHLLWWAKAVAQRMIGVTEGPELENAHFLAPLDPVLRAEAFLRQPADDSSASSSLLATLANHPAEFIEAASLYVEHGLFQDASRLIGEFLRHSNSRMLRYLLAYTMLEGTRMETEAAVQVAAAAKADGSIRPWRAIESVALRRLGDRFQDPVLRQFVELA